MISGLISIKGSPLEAIIQFADIDLLAKGVVALGVEKM